MKQTITKNPSVLNELFVLEILCDDNITNRRPMVYLNPQRFLK